MHPLSLLVLAAAAMPAVVALPAGNGSCSTDPFGPTPDDKLYCMWDQGAAFLECQAGTKCTAAGKVCYGDRTCPDCAEYVHCT